MTDSREERVARAICEASGQTWRDKSERPSPGLPHDFDFDALNNHWRHKARAAIAALELSPDVSRESEWQPVETAKRDGTPVLVKLRDDIYPGLRPERPDLKDWNGIVAVMLNRNNSSDWCFAAPVGQGGFPDEWMVGWKYPDPPKVKTTEEDRA